MNSSRFITYFFTNILIPLLIGGTIYLLFRPDTLILFRILDFFKIEQVDVSRTALSKYSQYIPQWVVYCLPNALWVYSFSMYIEHVWRGEKIGKIFVYCTYLLSLLLELLQYFQIISGTFSFGDLISILIACALSQVVILINKNYSK